MGGFMGIGHSSAKTDRGAQLGARQGLWNVFNWSLPQGEKGQAQGQAGLGEAQGFWSRMMKAGRSDIASMSAPAINAATEQADAQRRQAGAFGTGRTGGATAMQREAGTATTKTVDDIINQNLWGARTEGAKGLASTSGMQLTNAANMLGLGTGAVEDIMSNATQSRQNQQQNEAAAGQAAAEMALAIALM